MIGHVLYQDGDTNIPEQITDRNGQVVLSTCRQCGASEIELTEYDNCDSFRQHKQSVIENHCFGRRSITI